MTTSLFFLKNITLTFGGEPLINDLSLQIFKGDKIALIGKNGSGKSSLMKIMMGIYEQDKGEKFLDPACDIGYLSQNTIFNPDDTIYDYILSDLKSKENNAYKVDIILEKLKLEGAKKMQQLSGGQLRRASLAKALVAEPAILLLDEPTNHLDINSIEWLENYLKNYKGGLVCISHDRAFLTNISNKVFWLDRGKLRILDKGFAHFEEWSDSIYEIEHKELQKLGKKLIEENLWLQQGVTARRKRNQGRLKKLWELREKLSTDKNKWQNSKSAINVESLSDVSATKLIVEMQNVTHFFTDVSPPKKIIDNFSIKIMKGEKIGLIGGNGTGKTTLIKLLTKNIPHSEGKIKIGKNIVTTYFDQNRESLDLNKTLWETLCSEGGDTILVGGKPKHVASYLKDFLFDPKQAHSPVSSLSGGEANRLILAKILANPGDFLILDEPTNDLDMDSLDILQDVLSEYTGTLLIVSHDRDFLDRLVTRTLIFEGEGKIQDFIGGYTDYKRELVNEQKIIKSDSKKIILKDKISSNKLSYKFIRELELLPSQISSLEEEIKNLELKVSDPNLYNSNPTDFNKSISLLSDKKIELEKLENRWFELEELKAASD